MEHLIKQLKESILKANAVVVLTGAGISAESGIPTFRGAEGIWRNYDPTQLATPEAFAENPRLVWEFYNWRRKLISGIQYNAAHAALAELETRVANFTLISQNVDGLHIKAGSKNLIEIHGNLWKVRCTKCHTVTLDFSSDMGALPKCKACGEPLRPHVVWFGENLDSSLLERSFELVQCCDLIIVIGTSAIVQPVASFPVMAKRAGAVVAEINLDPTPLSKMADITLFGKATEITPKLLENWPE